MCRKLDLYQNETLTFALNSWFREKYPEAFFKGMLDAGRIVKTDAAISNIELPLMGLGINGAWNIHPTKPSTYAYIIPSPVNSKPR